MTTITTPELLSAPPLPLDEDERGDLTQEEVEEPFMSVYAALIATRLGSELTLFLKTHDIGQAVVEAFFGLRPRSRRKHRPDVAFVSYTRWARDRLIPLNDPWPVVPDLAVEVVSPNDLAESITTKVKEYLEAGVRLVWVIYPTVGWAHIFESLTRMRGLTVTDTLDGGDVLPGFALPLRELFTQPIPSPEDEPEETKPEAGQGA